MAARQELEILLKMKADLDQGLGNAIKGLRSVETEAKKTATNATASLDKLDKGFQHTSTSAGGLADAVGRTATTMARSASAFGLPTEALRSLDDVMDIAELGFNNLSKSAAGFNVASIGVAGAGLAIGTVIGGWLREIPAVSAAADKAAASLHYLFTGIEPKEATAGLKEWQAQIAAANDKAIQLQIASQGGLEVVVKGALAAKEQTKALAEATAIVGRNIKNIDEAKAIIKVRDDTTKAADSMKKFGEEAKKAREALFASFEKESLRQSMEAEEKAIKDADEALDKLAATHLDLVQQAEKADLLFDWEDNLTKAQNAAADLYNEMVPLLAVTMGVSEAMVRGFTGGAEGAGELEKKVSGGLKNALKDLPNVILGAIQGGGNVFSAIGASMGKDIGKGLSEKIGGLTGSLGKFLGPLGDLAGPVLTLIGSKLGGLIDKLGIFGNKAIMETNKARDAFFKAQGGFATFSQKMAQVSKEDWAKKIFDAKTVEEFNALVTESQRLLGLQDQAQQMVNDAMDKYGLTIDEMGPRWAAQELNQKAQSLYQDYQLLIGAGADQVAVIEKMGPALNEYVNSSIKAGVAIPESMRATIDAMYAQGMLLHENGEAFTEAEYKGLSFTQSMDQQFQSLIKSISDLVAALTGIPNVNRTVTTTHRDEYPGGGGGQQEPQFGRGGVVLPFRRAAQGTMTSGPTHVLMGEAGPEVAAPVAALFGKLADTIAAKVAAVSGGGGGGVTVYIGSEQVSAHVVRDINSGRGGKIRKGRLSS